MDDSDQDFVDLCSKLLKRVRKKPGEPRQPRKAEHQPSSQASDGEKRRRNNKRDGDSGSKCAGSQQRVVCRGTGCESGDAGSSGVPAAAGPRAERGLTAKDKVLQRMQQFKRASPQRMGHKEKSGTTNHESDGAPPPPLVQRQGEMTGCSSHTVCMQHCCSSEQREYRCGFLFVGIIVCFLHDATQQTWLMLHESQHF